MLAYPRRWNASGQGVFVVSIWVFFSIFFIIYKYVSPRPFFHFQFLEMGVHPCPHDQSICRPMRRLKASLFFSSSFLVARGRSCAFLFYCPPGSADPEPGVILGRAWELLSFYFLIHPHSTLGLIWPPPWAWVHMPFPGG